MNRTIECSIKERDVNNFPVIHSDSTDDYSRNPRMWDSRGRLSLLAAAEN